MKAQHLAMVVLIPRQADRTFTFKAQWRNVSNTIIRTDTISSYKARTIDWEQATKRVVASTGAASVDVKLVASSLNGTIFVDDCLFQISGS